MMSNTIKWKLCYASVNTIKCKLCYASVNTIKCVNT